MKCSVCLVTPEDGFCATVTPRELAVFLDEGLCLQAGGSSVLCYTLPVSTVLCADKRRFIKSFYFQMVTQNFSTSPKFIHNFLWSLHLPQCLFISWNCYRPIWLLYYLVWRIFSTHVFSQYVNRRFLRNTDKELRNIMAFGMRKWKSELRPEA